MASSFTLVVDTQSPTLLLDVSVAGVLPKSNAAHTIDDVFLVEATFNKPYGWARVVIEDILGATHEVGFAVEDSRIIAAIPSAQLPPGSGSVRVTFCDDAGNEVEATRSVHIYRDQVGYLLVIRPHSAYRVRIQRRHLAYGAIVRARSAYRVRIKRSHR